MVEIKAVIFDWGGVLIENPLRKFNTYYADSLGVSEEDLIRTYHPYASDFQKGNIKEDELFSKIRSELGVRKKRNASLWREAFEFAYSPREEMFSLASKLKDKGYKTGILSNAEMPSVRFFIQQGYDMFDVKAFSCLVGTRKPEELIYRLILKRLQVEPEEAVFIDDNPSYVEGGRNVGINAILFDNLYQMKRELDALSVQVY